MTVHPSPRNLAADMVRRLSKQQPRTKRPKNPGEAKTRQLVKERSGGWCEVCGAARAESIHHRRKRSQGGPWTASNCVHTCGDGTRGCHGWAEHNADAADPAGFHLRPGDDSTLKPIVSGLHGVVLLDDTGGVTPIGGAA